MVATYRLNVNELSVELINSIKAVFKDKDVEITVTDGTDETAYLLASVANRKSLEKAMIPADEGKLIAFTVQELDAKYSK
jgi:antitoxin YefM